MIKRILQAVQRVNKVLDMFIFAFFAMVFGVLQVPSVKIDNDVQPFYQEFQMLVDTGCPTKDLLRHPGRITMTKQYFDPSDLAVGECRVMLNLADIRISETYWNYITYDEKYQLAMHEMTHCFLGHWYIAKFPFHVSDPKNYMYYQMSNITTAEVQEQVIQVAKDMCEQ